MSYNLVNESGESFKWDNVEYLRVLDFAELYGWRPHGTGADWELLDKISPHFERGKFTRPKVSATDAENMADALIYGMHQLTSPDDFHVLKFESSNGRPLIKPDWSVHWETYGLYGMNVFTRLDYWTQNLDRLNKFVRFLRKGAYTIILKPNDFLCLSKNPVSGGCEICKLVQSGKGVIYVAREHSGEHPSSQAT